MTGHVIHVAMTMHAPANVVWDVLTDVEARPDTMDSVKNVSDITPGPWAVGKKWREERDLLDHRHSSEDLEVTQVDEPHHTAVLAAPAHDKVLTSYALTPNHGGTRLSVTMAADMSKRSPGSKLAWALWGELGFHKTRRMLLHELDDIAQEAERRAGTVSA